MRSKNVWLVLALIIMITLILVPYGSAAPRGLTQALGATVQSATAINFTPTPRTTASGNIVIVNSTADDNIPGTLRYALENQRSGDTITFDPEIFPPSSPATIYPLRNLPGITQGNITIDASNAGVILNGEKMWEPPWGLRVISNNNTLMGVQLINFYSGIDLCFGAQDNFIGGDRSIGSGPLGQGNLTSKCVVGMQLIDEGTSLNTITGNLIGTDPTGIDDWGNEFSGISIHDGASHNIIGPNNVIACNGHFGIQLGRGSADIDWSVGNTFTGNSIHSNNLGGVELWGESNKSLIAPVILDLDLGKGLVIGATIADYTVEIFSDGGVQGEIFEGQVKADANGTFTLNKEGPFTGPNITATATDDEGNTSLFSVPTFGTDISAIIQEGNSFLRIQIQPKESSELANNRLGGLAPADVQSDWDLEDWLYKTLTSWGYKWLRTGFNTTFDWPHNIVPPELGITSYQDEAIDVLVENGVEIIFILSYISEEKVAEGPYYLFKEEEEIQEFLDYVQFIVHNLKDRVQYYEILCEPDLESYGKPFVEVADYINLVQRTAPVIREEYPEAKIVVPCVSGIWGKEAEEYLFTVLESDIMPLVDVITWHNGGASPVYQSDYYYDYESIVQEIKETASEYGFKGEYFIEELIWNSPGDQVASNEYTEYSRIEQAKYSARGIIMNVGMDFPHVGVGLNIEPEKRYQIPATKVIQNLCTIMAGVEPADIPIEIRREEQSTLSGCQLSCGNGNNIKYYSFSLPDGDKLIGLWVDIKATDDYSGIATTIIIPNFSANTVMGIDILYGFTQELITSIEDGNLIIENLILKDYPILLQLTR